jgi:hypothetical protein
MRLAPLDTAAAAAAPPHSEPYHPCCVAAAAVAFVLWAVPMGMLGCADALINLVAVSVRLGAWP